MFERTENTYIGCAEERSSKTHKVGKSGHPGNDSAAPAVIAPEWQLQPTTGLDRLSDGRTVVAFVIDSGLNCSSGSKVPDGLPRVRRRSEPVRRPVGRGGRRNQEEADVAPGLVRGQNEVRRSGREHGTSPATPTASTLEPQSFAAPSARPSAGPSGSNGRGRVGPDAKRSAGSAAVAARRLDASDRPTDRPVVRPTSTHSESRASADERVHGGTRSAPTTGCRSDAFRVLRRTGRVVDQLVGRRHGRRGRIPAAPTA